MRLKTPILILGMLFSSPIIAQEEALMNQVQDSLKSILQSEVLKYEEQLDISLAQTRISAEEIIARGYDNLDELINSIQGLYITHDRTETQIGVRGLSPSTNNNQRILILIDNIPLNNPLTGASPGGAALRGLAMEDIAEVSVLRSPSSVLYGNGAMLGLIKITTKRSEGLRLNFDMGSFGELDGGFAYGQQLGGVHLSVSGRLASLNGEDIFQPKLGTFTAKGDAMDYQGYQIQLEAGEFSFSGAYNHREGNIANGVDYSSFFDSPGFFDEDIWYGDLSFRTEVNEQQSIYTHVYLNYQQRNRFLLYEEGPDLFEIERSEQALALGLEYEHLFQWSERHQLLIGTEYWYTPESSFNTIGNINGDAEGNFSFQTFSLFAHDTYQFNDKWKLNGGIRVDFSDRSNTQYSPQIALAYQGSPKSKFQLGFSRAYRLPSFLETDINEVQLAIPNGNLLPENVQSWELAWEQVLSDKLKLNLMFYQQSLENLIDIDQNTFDYVNVDAFDSQGLEGGLLLEMANGVQSYFNYNFPFNSPQRLNVPSPLCKFGITLPFLQHFKLFTEGIYEGSRTKFDGAQSLPYFLLNGNLLIQPKLKDPAKAPWLQRSSISIRLYNALDQVYQHPANILSSDFFVTQRGRTWQTQLTLQF